MPFDRAALGHPLVPSDRLLQVAEKRISMMDAFRMADDIMYKAVQGITDLITVPYLVNLDFDDVRTIMQDLGLASMGIYANGLSVLREAACPMRIVMQNHRGQGAR